jgi:hypothetical protein
MSTQDPIYPPLEAHHDAAGHETSDVNVRGIFGFAIALAAVALLVHFVVWLMFLFFDAGAARTVQARYPLAVTQAPRVPPEPRLQTNPRGDLRDLRAGEDDLLTSYSWVDRNAGIVRIPIDDAMRLVVERGLPARQGGGQ